MEVHHHGHHSGKKNWKSYFWEFLMLFLAVFCGFMAEWRLERMIENHREEEYIHTIVEDINADVVQTEKLLINIDSRIQKTDSLLAQLSSTEILQQSNTAYNLWFSTIGFPDFAQNDRTIQQLKSSGSLRIIRKKEVSDKIMEYDQEVRLIYVTQSNMNAVASNNTLFNQMFDLINLNKPNAAPTPLTETGKKLLNEGYGNRLFWKLNLSSYQKKLTQLNQKGKDVVALIKQKYSLK